MGAVREEFDRTLREHAVRFANDPRRETQELLFLALEREEIVSVAYSETLMARRLDVMPVPDDVRAILRQALAWVWKDEEMHAIYIRGVLLRLGNLPMRMLARKRSLEGALGGWASFVLQHVGWDEAPVSRLVANVLTALGVAAGKVPSAVRKELQQRSFRSFCEFNVDAEATAAACWNRLVVLGGRGLPDEAALRLEFQRMATDEDRHRRVFGVIGQAIGAGDRLSEGWSAERLGRELREVDEPFVPRRFRREELAAHPLGAGGRVVVRRSPPGTPATRALRGVVADAGLADLLVARAAETGRAVRDLRVIVKPAFMLAHRRDDVAHVTAPELVDELVAIVREHGCEDVRVAESRNIYDRFFGNRGVADVAREIGIRSPVHDFNDDQQPHAYARGMHQATISAAWRDAEVRIAFGKMRSHPVDGASLTVGTVEGIGGRWDEFLFEDRRLDRHAALMMLLHEFPPHFALLDAHDSASDGLLGMMGCIDPPAPRRLYAARDALALDLVAARHLGALPLARVPQLRAACTWFGDPSKVTEVVGEDTPLAGWRGPRGTMVSALLAAAAMPAYTHGSGRGSLFVPAMDERAFPPLGRPSLACRAGRAACRTLLRLPQP